MDFCLINPHRVCQDRAHLILHDHPLNIGRGPRNDVRLCNFHVSRKHCEVWRRGDEIVVRDCNSRNGTHIDGRRLESGTVTPILPGQILHISDIPFLLTELDLDWDVLHHELVLNMETAIQQTDDWCSLPILGDALEDVGCTDGTILDHCHGDLWHSRGCWVVELILRGAQAFSEVGCDC